MKKLKVAIFISGRGSNLESLIQSASKKNSLVEVQLVISNNSKAKGLAIAKKNKIPFIWNERFPINSLYLMRGFLYIDKEKKNKFFDTCFDAYWKDNTDISKHENIMKILSDCGIDQNSFNTGIKEDKIKRELKELTSLAFEKNIFGAPTFIVNGKLFWGQDRLEYALDEFRS